jgi:carboxypeptidase C (cathepsin A)
LLFLLLLLLLLLFFFFKKRNRNADLVIFDQPFGVGLSLTSSNTTCLPQNTDQSSDQLANAIDWLFLSKQFGLTGKRLFLFGESYAGTWIPLLARKLLEKHPLINLSGLGMGDGWVSPVQQQATYSKFAALHGLINGENFVACRFGLMNCRRSANCADAIAGKGLCGCNQRSSFSCAVSR